MIVLAFLAATFVGNSACRPCHTAIFDRYAQTPMARTSGNVTDAPAGKFGNVRITPTGIAESNVSSRQLDFFIGSGSHGRSYLHRRDGYLYQAPFTWYAQRNAWDASPGYEKDKSLRWGRPIEPNCLWCHASQARPIYGTVNRYADPPFSQDGVGCERCHGPGSEHIAGKSRMVNPAKLDAVRRDAVCAQCHLSGEARVENPEKRLAMYRPGELLSDYVAYYVPDASAMKATSHYEKLAASACKRQSGDKLWCGTCHSPHREVSTRQACLSCHDLQTCKRGEDCASCHMPKRRAVDGGHGVLTDHSIPRRPTEVRDAPSTWKLVPWPGYGDLERNRGLAYAELYTRTGDRRQLDEALRLLSTNQTDAKVLVSLGYLNQQIGENRKAAEFYSKALRSDAFSLLALVNLGGLEAADGHLETAISLWRRALAANPLQVEAIRNIVTALRALGRNREAEQYSDSLRFLGE